MHGLSYRATVALLGDCSDLRDAIGLERVPHFTALQKAARRLLVARAFRRLITANVGRARAYRIVRRRPKLAAIDASGFESRRCSRYFARRRKASGKRGRKRRVVYRRFPKL